MTVASKLKKVVKSAKAATKKVARKVDKAVVEPVAKMIRPKGKSSKKKTTAGKTRSKATKK